MRLVHPVARRDEGVVDDAVYVDGEAVPVDDDGTFEAPESWAQTFAARYDTTLDELRVDDGPDTCQEVKNDGEVCGRDLPCPYHSDTED